MLQKPKDCLEKYVFSTQQTPLEDSDENLLNRCERHYLIKKQTFMYDGQESLLVLLHDVTEYHMLQEEQKKVQMMKFLHATVSHDMMAPIKNI